MTARSDKQRIARPGEAAGWLPLALVRMDRGTNGGEILASWVRKLQRAGRRVAGVVQKDRARSQGHACDMVLENLTTGEELCLSANRGPGARGCRLDFAALAEATLWIERAIATHPQLLALNKFGKEEALGRGFFPAMAEALACGIPVIAGVSAHNLDDALALTEGAAALIEPTEAAMDSWGLSVSEALVSQTRIGDE